MLITTEPPVLQVDANVTYKLDTTNTANLFSMSGELGGLTPHTAKFADHASSDASPDSVLSRHTEEDPLKRAAAQPLRTTSTLDASIPTPIHHTVTSHPRDHNGSPPYKGNPQSFSGRLAG